MQLSKGVVVGGKYELVRPLAAGGMGALWVAHHRDLEVDVAIKFMSDDLADQDTGRRRFRREAKAAAKLRSAHVAQILDYGVDNETPYIVMELLEGRDLATVLDEEGPLAVERARGVLTHLVRGLKLAHERGIVHRDLKPSNVFVARVGDDDVVKILDFGIAKHTASDVDDATQTGAVVGSPHYMSPEQTLGDPVDHRSDLWSLGVVLFQMLTMRRPFEGHTVGKIVAGVCSAPPPRAAELGAERSLELPAQFDAFFERALHKSRERRFQDADELLEGFSALAEGAALPAPRSPRPTSQLGRETDTVDLDPEEVTTPVPPARVGAHDDTSPGLGVDTRSTPRPRARWRVAALLVGVGAIAFGLVRARRDVSLPSVTVESGPVGPAAVAPQGAPRPSASPRDATAGDAPSTDAMSGAAMKARTEGEALLDARGAAASPPDAGASSSVTPPPAPRDPSDRRSPASAAQLPNAPPGFEPPGPRPPHPQPPAPPGSAPPGPQPSTQPKVDPFSGIVLP